jgi:hypothetical protein
VFNQLGELDSDYKRSLHQSAGGKILPNQSRKQLFQIQKILPVKNGGRKQ